MKLKLFVITALFLFYCKIVIADENLEVEKYRCVDGRSFDIIEHFDGRKNRYNLTATKYLSDWEFEKYASDISENLRDNIEAKNEAIVQLYFQAVTYFHTANIERLKQVKGILDTVNLMNDDISLVYMHEDKERTLFYQRNELWFNRYRITAMVEYWLWYLTREEQHVNNMNKSLLLSKDTFARLPEYLKSIFMGGEGEDISYTYYVNEFDRSFDSDVGFANFISGKSIKFDDDRYINFQKSDREYWDLKKETQYFNNSIGFPNKKPRYPIPKPNAHQVHQAFTEGMGMLFENGQWILRNGQLRVAHGLAADKEIDLLIRQAAVLSENCMDDMLDIYNAMITTLAVGSANIAKQQDRICEFKNIADTSLASISESYSSVYVNEALSVKYDERVKNINCSIN